MDDTKTEILARAHLAHHDRVNFKKETEHIKGGYTTDHRGIILLPTELTPLYRPPNVAAFTVYVSGLNRVIATIWLNLDTNRYDWSFFGRTPNLTTPRFINLSVCLDDMRAAYETNREDPQP